VALRRRFENSKEPLAISITALSDDQLARFVHEIVEVGRQHGFDDRGDFYALAEAAAILGPRNLLSKPVLSNPNLTGSEKVGVMVDLCAEARALRQAPV